MFNTLDMEEKGVQVKKVIALYGSGRQYDYTTFRGEL